MKAICYFNRSPALNPESDKTVAVIVELSY